jgi:hypothetical protein
LVSFAVVESLGANPTIATAAAAQTPITTHGRATTARPNRKNIAGRLPAVVGDFLLAVR